MDIHKNVTGGSSTVDHEEYGLGVALSRQWGTAPWFFSSIVMHLFLFVLLLLFAPAPKPPHTPNIHINTMMDEYDVKVEEPPVVENPPIDNWLPDDFPDYPVVKLTPPPIQIDQDFTIDMPQISEDDKMPQDDKAFAEIPEDTTMAVIGVEFVPSARAPQTPLADERLKKRNPGRNEPPITREARKALKLGLRWLAKNQEPDGRWSCSKHGGGDSDIAVTSLAMLAFLGEGNSTRYGLYRKNVLAAQCFLLKNYQENPGMIGKYRYEAAIAMMALAESWAMSGRKELQPIVQKMAEYASSTQAGNGGWGYKPLSNPIAAHVDSSVSGWWMMGLKSAKLAGAKVPERNWAQAVRYFKSVTRNNDKFVTSGYQGPGDSANLTAVGLTCLQFLGMSRRDQFVKGQADYFMQNPSKMINSKFSGGNPYYGWYYQALGLYQMGTRSVYWKKFAPVMQKVLVDLQVNKGFNKGVWPLKLPWADSASNFESAVGMVGTTAISCLTLEVFWRYPDVHDRH